MATHREQMTDSRAFGSATRLHEANADVWGWTWLDDVRRDLRYGARRLLRAPKYTLSAMSVLAGGAGVALGVLQLANAAYFHTLSLEDAAALVSVSEPEDFITRVPYATAVFYRHHARSFSYVIAEHRGLVVSVGDDPRPVSSAFVSDNYFQDLKVTAALGRLLAESDGRPDSPAVAVLGYHYWQVGLGADPGAVGRVLRVNNRPVEIVGIAPSSFDGLARPGTATVAIWLPMSVRPLVIEHSPDLDDSSRSDTAVYGVLKPAVTPAAASAEVKALTRDFFARRRELTRAEANIAVTRLVGPPRFEGDIAFLFLLVGLIFVSACANLGNVSLARALARHRELRLCMALGASPGRLVRQLVTENVLLALLGCAVGAGAGYYTALGLRRLLTDLPSGLHIVFDGPMMVLSGATVLVAVCGFGLYPALQALRERQPARRLRRVFVAIQVAASCVLLILSSVLWRSSERLNTLGPGFDDAHVLVVDPQLTARILDPATQRTLLGDIASRLGGVAGVTGVTMATEGVVMQSGSVPALLTFEVAPSYFDVLGLAVVRGRAFAAGDGNVMLVSESAARAIWPDRDPIGASWTFDRATRVIIGIVRDRTNGATRNRGGEGYLPISDAHVSHVVLLAHAKTDAADLFRRARDVAAASGVTPTVRVLRPAATTSNSGNLALMVTLGSVATLLAFTGVFGLVAFAVAQRTREIGIRLALGAEPHDVLRALIAEQAAPLIGGLAAGIALAIAGAFVMQSEIQGVSRLDPISQMLGIAGFSAVALVAILLPARRALRVNPAVTLRSE